MNEKVDKITTKEIGARLLLVRQGLGLTQADVAKAIDTTQAKLSQIEKGYRVTTPTFLRLLSFYSLSISLDALFAEKMDFVTHENLFNKDYALSKVVKERIDNLHHHTLQKLRQTAVELEQEFKDTLSIL